MNHLFAIHANPATKRWLRTQWNLSGKFRFEDRSKGASRLVIIVAGFKSELWPATIPRFAKFIPADFDVCLVCPGIRNAWLRETAEKHAWSVLETDRNRLALAQNLAIREHAQALKIFKFDEDILIGRDYFETMESCWNQILADDQYELGILAPLLNVNGFTSRLFIDAIGKTDEFIQTFGTARKSCMNTPFWSSPEAAQYLWTLSCPFDAMVQRFLDMPLQYTACPHRFSIGAFLIERSFWHEMQGFSVACDGELGVEEIDLSAVCHSQSKIIAVSQNVFAGHFGFGSQTSAIPKILECNFTLSE